MTYRKEQLDLSTADGDNFVSNVCQEIRSSLAFSCSLQGYAERLRKIPLAPRGQSLRINYRMRVSKESDDAPIGQRELYVRWIGGTTILGGHSSWPLSSQHYSVQFNSEHDLVNPEASELGSSSVDGRDDFQSASSSQGPQSSLDQIHPILGMHEMLRNSFGVSRLGTDGNQAALLSYCRIAFRIADARFHYNRMERIEIRILEEDSGRYRSFATAYMSREEFEQYKQNGPLEMKPPAAHRAYIALGSNMGDCVKNIESACHQLTKRNIFLSRSSFLYKTKPMYFDDQQWFVNGVCEVFDHYSQSMMPMRLNVRYVGANLTSTTTATRST